MAKPSPYRFGVRKKSKARLLYRPWWLGNVVVGAVIVALGLGGCTTTTSPAALASSVATAPVTITDIAAQTRDDTLHITVEATGEMQYTAFRLQEPPRLVVDIADAMLAPHLQPVVLPQGIASRIEPVAFPDKEAVRLLLPLRQAATHTIEAQGPHLQIRLADAAKSPARGDEQVPATTPAVTSAAAPTPVTGALGQEVSPPSATVVTGVAFRSLPGASVIEVQVAGPLPRMRVKQRTKPLRLTLDVVHARLSPEQDKLMAVHDPAGVVTQVQAVQSTQDQDETVHIVAYLRTEAPFEVRQEDNHVRVILTNTAPVMQTAGHPMATPEQNWPVLAASQPASPTVWAPAAPSVAMPPGETPVIAQAAPTPAEGAPPAGAQGVPTPIAPSIIRSQTRKEYTGEKISLDFQNADINDILRLIAEVSGLNIIAGPDVKGTVTTRMIDVPWDQALDVVLKINGLDQEREDNIVRVAPIERFINERQERLRALKAEVQAEPTLTQIVPISYADVEELKTNLERLLSDRGSIWIDTRTNTMIVTDVKQHVEDVLTLVETLDKQTPQVMIESRIVEASRQFLRELGVRLGTRFVQTTDRNFPSTVAVDGGVQSAGEEGSSAGNFLVDLPAAVGTGSGGAITFALAGASRLINIQLSALESSGLGKVVTNPKIATLDNTEALIENGRRIPYSTISNDGTKTEFADASIKLRVTPHVAPDGFIDLKVHVTKNEADFSRTSANGVPTILTREATTEMLIRDGDTVVIGGLYQRTLQTNRNGVPWLSQVPGLGWLFKKTRKEDNHEELLIFITPRIIKQPDVPKQAHASVTN